MSGLRERLGAELRRPLAAPVRDFAAAVGGHGALATLFYGSALRSGDLDGLLDFYVLFESLRDSRQSALARLANRCLPPNVGYVEYAAGGLRLRAKVALMSLRQFEDGMHPRRLDTTLWARFAQPAACAWHREGWPLDSLLPTIERALVTAAGWAAVLGPESGTAMAYWRALLRSTYAAELRVERGDRAEQLLESETERYTAVLPLAWRLADLPFVHGADGLLAPQIAPPTRRAARRAWALRRRLGKPLNLARLAKASLTFEGAADYVAWKVQRHTGEVLALQPWQRRHPLLAAPGVLWTLHRRGLLR